MEILNIGPLELIVILVIMFVLLGPKQMVITAYQIGKFIRGVVRSPMWKEIIGYSEEIRELPKKLMEETELEGALSDVKKSTQDAADELKSSLKEVSEAARIPEAEHVRLESGAAAAASAGPQAIQSQASETPSTANLAPAAQEPAPEPVARPVPEGVLVGIPAIPFVSAPQPEVDLPFEASLRPRRLREAVPAGPQGEPEIALAQVNESFAPRSVRRAQGAEYAVVTMTGAGDSQADHASPNGHNASNPQPASNPN